LVFGDSIAYGAWDTGGGWVQRLRKNFDSKKMGHIVYNLGIPGDDTSMLLRRFESEIKSRIGDEPTQKLLIIFAIGVNDAPYVRKLKNNWTPREKFRENVEALIEKARKFTDKIVFVGLLPVDEKLVVPVPWDTPLGKIDYKNNDLQYYNSVLKVICDTPKVEFIDLFNRFRDLKYQKLLHDGLHPNTKGHKLMYKLITEYLISNKIIKTTVY
jgi:lysophospholipase L1-like esterase